MLQVGSATFSSFSGIGRLNHVAVAVPQIKVASELFRKVLKAKVSEPQEIPEHGVSVSFVMLGNVNIELIEPLGKASPIQKYIEKNPLGGLHHICFEVDDINKAVDHVKPYCRLLNERPKNGSHGTPVTFIHPKDFLGVLVELEEL